MGFGISVSFFVLIRKFVLVFSAMALESYPSLMHARCVQVELTEQHLVDVIQHEVIMGINLLHTMIFWVINNECRFLVADFGKL